MGKTRRRRLRPLTPAVGLINRACPADRRLGEPRPAADLSLGMPAGPRLPPPLTPSPAEDTLSLSNAGMAGMIVEEGQESGTVSLRVEVPEPLLLAMREFIEAHPNWDQYRLVQAALAGFLVQNGVRDRGVTRCYLANLFPGRQRFSVIPGADPLHGAVA